MSIYFNNRGPTIIGLMSKVNELSTKRIALDEEIDLARALLIRATDYWNATLEANVEDGKKQELIMMCEKLCRDGVDAVTKVVSSAAKVRLIDQGAMQLESVEWVVAEITKIIDTEIREHAPSLADEVVGKIASIKLPVDGTLQKFTSQASDEKFL